MDTNQGLTIITDQAQDPTKKVIDDTPTGLFSRQANIIRPDELPKCILIIGAGGIGSWTALALAKMGAQKLMIMDFDSIEDVNIAPQFFKMSDIGKFKAEVLADRINEEMGQKIAEPLVGRWEEWPDKDERIVDVNVLIMAVDSMDVRLNIWKDIEFAGLDLVVDARMTKELMEILLVDPSLEEDKKMYATRLFPSSEVEHTDCTERAVAYNQFVIAGLIAAQIKHFVKQELLVKRIFFDLFSFNIIAK